MTEYAIRTENLTRDFPSVRAVDALNLDIPPGMVFGFLGPNGSGKTTTIHLLLGLLNPTSGRAEVLGYDTRADADLIREQTGALLEHSGLYERLSAEENLELYGRIQHMPPAERQARIKELLTHLDLWERRGERIKTWSRGMKQKIAIARALLHHPRVIFLDEPTAGFDPVAAAALRTDLAALVAREGVTVFLNTHNLTEAEKLCSLVGVIRRGKLVAIGTPDELRARAGGVRVEITGSGFDTSLVDDLRAQASVAAVEASDGHLSIALCSGQTEVAPLVSLIVQAGAQVEGVHKNAASLEDVFLELVEDET